MKPLAYLHKISFQMSALPPLSPFYRCFTAKCHTIFLTEPTSIKLNKLVAVCVCCVWVCLSVSESVCVRVCESEKCVFVSVCVSASAQRDQSRLSLRMPQRFSCAFSYVRFLPSNSTPFFGSWSSPFSRQAYSLGTRRRFRFLNSCIVIAKVKKKKLSP
jgi:hypothetical protein